MSASTSDVWSSSFKRLKSSARDFFSRSTLDKSSSTSSDFSPIVSARRPMAMSRAFISSWAFFIWASKMEMSRSSDADSCCLPVISERNWSIWDSKPASSFSSSLRLLPIASGLTVWAKTPAAKKKDASIISLRIKYIIAKIMQRCYSVFPGLDSFLGSFFLFFGFGSLSAFCFIASLFLLLAFLADDLNIFKRRRFRRDFFFGFGRLNERDYFIGFGQNLHAFR